MLNSVKLLGLAGLLALSPATISQSPPGPMPSARNTQEKEGRAAQKSPDAKARISLWKTEENTSEFDGKKTQVVFQIAAKKVADGFGKEREVALDFSCGLNEVGPLLRFDGGFEATDFHQRTSWTKIRYRFQTAGVMGPIREADWFTGPQYAAPLHSLDFASEAFRSDVLLIEFTPFHGAASTTRFNLQGLRSALADLETCKGVVS